MKEERKGLPKRWLFFFFALLKEGGVKNSEIEMINFEEAFY
jgi:hypothetical protein